VLYIFVYGHPPSILSISTHRSLAARKAEEHIRSVAMWHLPEDVQQLGRVTRPLAIGGLHRPKEQLQLLHRYAIAGQLEKLV